MSNEMGGANQQTKIDKYWRIYYNFKSQIKITAHTVWWRFLWATKLGRPYSKFMCKMNWYKKFPDGRCMYCGVVK